MLVCVCVCERERETLQTDKLLYAQRDVHNLMKSQEFFHASITKFVARKIVFYNACNFSKSSMYCT
jgi:hypothetical protein